MRSTDAAKLVNSAAFHPDYQIIATPVFGQSLVLQVQHRTYDSSDIDHWGQYYRRVTIGPTYDLEVADLDEDGVLFGVAQKLLEFQGHEIREFLRVQRGGDWVAPFHPHTRNGRDNWEKRGGKTA
jgi:hypothetical protein